ncbi:MAG: hypothetical protein KIH08_11890 [Candidatus Freyarchaeota archaeon]|nr:hypothetical protein [Candidatus Jordarchaeia archaeon]
MDIKAVYVIKDTGYALFHRAYDREERTPDELLVGGFISAIFNFFREFCEDQIVKMETKLLKLFYHPLGEIIFVVITKCEKNTDDTPVKELLRKLAEKFVYKFGEVTNDEVDSSKFLEFEKTVDELVEEYNNTKNNNLGENVLEKFEVRKGYLSKININLQKGINKLLMS